MMLCIKKVYMNEIFQLALIIGLIRVNQDPLFSNYILNGAIDFDFENGTAWRSTLTPNPLRNHYVHPKSLDSVLLNYERELFADLNSLGRYNRGNFRHTDVQAYLLNIERNAAGTHHTENTEEVTAPPENTAPEESIPEILTPPAEVSSDGLELTQEDMDLIEVLWKQDVDLGFSLELARQEEQLKEKSNVASEFLKNDSDPSTSLAAEEVTEALKQTDKNEKIKEEEPDIEAPEEDIWAGVDYTIDTETGEYVIKGEPGAEANPSCDLEDLALPLPFLDEAFSLADLDDENVQKNASGLLAGLKALENSSKKAVEESLALNVNNTELDDDFDLFADMIQTPQFHHPHHRAAFQSRMPFVRTVSMEQRWQDLANLLSLPNPGEIHPFGAHHALQNYGHPHAHAHPATTYDARGVLLHNATLPTPIGDLNSTMPYGNLGGTIGNAVATSMNLTNSSEPMGEPSGAPHYKLEPSNDMMYYQNNTGAEFGNNQTDGFLSNLLNDEDLQLMDMAMNEGMYTMRMLESNNAVSNLSMNSTAAGTTTVSRHEMERMDTSSDSAVSSMGSERVPSLSDGEWCDAGSDSGHTTNGEHYPQDYQNKYRPFDYSYSNRLSDNARMPPVPQKKHLMYGKRFHASGFSEYRDPANSFQPQNATREKMPEIKYSCSAEFNHLPRTPVDHIQHNHTYHLPAENSGAMQRPVSRDKSKSRKSEDEHLSRDEKRARGLNIPISVDDIINLPMDEFNERLSKYDLSEAQLSLIRDIRRRGKNKVAAQNCRKRKLDQILSLADEVKEMRDRKMSIMNEHKYSIVELKRMKDKYQQLYRHVFQNLRDADGNQYSPYQYSLQTAADGSILMVPRSNSTAERKEPPQNQKD